MSGYPKKPPVTPAVAISILATGKTMSADDQQPVLAKTRATSNCELREFPEIVQSKEEIK